MNTLTLEQVQTTIQRTASLTSCAALVGYLRDDVLNALGVRRSALLAVVDDNVVVLYADCVAESHLPASVAELPRSARIADKTNKQEKVLGWANLTLPVGGEAGIWLLETPPLTDGQKAQLSLVAEAAGLALKQIRRIEKVRSVVRYQIETYDALAHEFAQDLHGKDLNDLSTLKHFVDDAKVPAEFAGVYDLLSESLRWKVNKLHPASLNHGLRLSLVDLADRLDSRQGGKPSILAELDSENIIYATPVVNHLFRIVEHAVENAIEHAASSTIRISGTLAADSIDLLVEDDGVGFDLTPEQNPEAFAEKGWHGLACMCERASIAGAQIQVQSKKGRGTKVSINWRNNG